MAENREVILADFQACTGIEEVGEALYYLEEANWDLLAAINQAMPQATQQLPSEMSPDVEMIAEVKKPPQFSSSTRINSRNDMEARSRPGTSRLENCTETKYITFCIQHLNNEYKISLSDKSTVGELKQAIWEHSRIPPCQQRLCGWKKEPQSNSTPLHMLNISKAIILCLSTVETTSTSEIANIGDRMLQNFQLNVKDEINNKTYHLRFPGTRTIFDVKSDVFSLLDVPMRNQVWKGWPSSIKDDHVTLAQSGINFPQHDLSVNKLPAKNDKKQDIVELIDSDSSADEPDDFEEVQETFNVEDDLFIDNIKSTKIQRLMPENVEDEITGTLHFVEQYENRYGPMHPEFFTGTLDDAIKESCSKPAKDRKLLAVYLHHDNSVLSNVFCTHLLGSEAVQQILSANFIVWGWDITHESNKQRFLTSINQSLGTVAAMTVRNIDVDTLPALMIIMKSRSNTEIFIIVHGNVGVNELLTNLIQAVDVFQERRRADVEIEEERQARERVKQEQDRAYQESLAADRAKEEAKQMQEELQRRMHEQAESERLAEEARKEAHRLAIESSLPPEPQQETGDGVMKIRVRLPAGKFLERRFQPDTPLQILLNFLVVEGYPTEEYKVLSSWPRRDLTSMDSKLTLTELKFCPQETIILEER